MGLENGLYFGLPVGCFVAILFLILIEIATWIIIGKGFDMFDFSLWQSRFTMVMGIVSIITGIIIFSED